MWYVERLWHILIYIYVKCRIYICTIHLWTLTIYIYTLFLYTILLVCILLFVHFHVNLYVYYTFSHVVLHIPVLNTSSQKSRAGLLSETTLKFFKQFFSGSTIVWKRQIGSWGSLSHSFVVIMVIVYERTICVCLASTRS